MSDHLPACCSRKKMRQKKTLQVYFVSPPGSYEIQQIWPLAIKIGLSLAAILPGPHRAADRRGPQTLALYALLGASGTGGLLFQVYAAGGGAKARPPRFRKLQERQFTNKHTYIHTYTHIYTHTHTMNTPASDIIVVQPNQLPNDCYCC